MNILPNRNKLYITTSMDLKVFVVYLYEFAIFICISVSTRSGTVALFMGFCEV